MKQATHDNIRNGRSVYVAKRLEDTGIWVSPMNEFVGEVGKVIQIGGYPLIKFPGVAQAWHFPVEALQILEDEDDPGDENAPQEQNPAPSPVPLGPEVPACPPNSPAEPTAGDPEQQHPAGDSNVCLDDATVPISGRAYIRPGSFIRIYNEGESVQVDEELFWHLYDGRAGHDSDIDKETAEPETPASVRTPPFVEISCTFQGLVEARATFRGHPDDCISAIWRTGRAFNCDGFNRVDGEPGGGV